MLTYKLTSSAWLAREVERAKGVLLAHMEPGTEYTVKELLTMLHDYGLDYSNPEYQEIGNKLIQDGFIEAV